MHFLSAPQTEFFQGYGLTETSPIATLSPKGIQNYSTVGWTASNCQTKIVDVDDPTFKGVNTNVPGELWIRGPNVMKGYYRNEEATRATITPDGWLRSGDICTYDEHGLIYIRDRIKELIKVNANQVAPAELEAVLRDHPDVLEAVVVGVPHPICGELPRAFVVKRPGSTVTEDEIKAFVAKQVIKYKQLTGGVDFIDGKPHERHMLQLIIIIIKHKIIVHYRHTENGHRKDSPQRGEEEILLTRRVTEQCI